MSRVLVQPYLFFSGRCEEALAFYEQTLGARVSMKMRFSESPEPFPDGMVPAGFENKIMHASFSVGEMMLMASDGCDENKGFEGFRLSLSVSTENQAEELFNALAEGGNVDMPLTQTFWSPRYGNVTDKFGVGWMVMVITPPQS
ncbi:MAG: VOC family protein [Pirellulaceae bacterium]